MDGKHRPVPELWTINGGKLERAIHDPCLVVNRDALAYLNLGTNQHNAACYFARNSYFCQFLLKVFYLMM
jgi:hypothetical protein